MNRKDFFKKSCAIGVCSCVLPGFFNTADAAGNISNQSTWKEGFVRNRFTKLIDILDNNLDEKTKNNVIESLGKECSKRSQIDQFKNNLDGFFEHIKKNYNETATYDKEKGLIRIETAERECFCPMFYSKKVSKSICQCSVGWQTQTYETILGQKVKATCIESVIRGSNRCVFEIGVVD